MTLRRSGCWSCRRLADGAQEISPFSLTLWPIGNILRSIIFSKGRGRMAIGFEGKVAIVTGAGGGLGRAHALALARRGAKVVVNDIGGGGPTVVAWPADLVVEEIQKLGGEALANHCDVTDEAGVLEMVAESIAKWGRVDILIN